MLFSTNSPAFFFSSMSSYLSVGGCFYCLQCWDGLYFFFYNDGCFYGSSSWLSWSRIARDFHDQMEGFRVWKPGLSVGMACRAYRLAGKEAGSDEKIGQERKGEFRTM